MLTERPPTQNVSSTPISLKPNALFENIDMSGFFQMLTSPEFSSDQLKTLMWEIAPVCPIPPDEYKQNLAQQVDSTPYPESDYEWLMEVLDTIADIVDRNFSNNFVALKERDYERLDSVLKELIYVVGDDDEHPLAQLMDFIGILITDYENRHFSKLSDLYPKLMEDVTPFNTKNGNEKGNPIKDLKKPLKTLAAEVFFSIGVFLFGQGKKEEAIFAYDQAIYLNPEYAHAYLLRGNVKTTLNQCDSAVDDFDKTLQLNLDNTLLYSTYMSRGCANLVLNRFESAIVDLSNGIEIYPDFAEAFLIRGYTKHLLERYESAIIDFDEGIRLDPDNAQAYQTRGEAHKLLDKIQKAKADFQRALELAKEQENQELIEEVKQSLQEFESSD